MVYVFHIQEMFWLLVIQLPSINCCTTLSHFTELSVCTLSNMFIDYMLFKNVLCTDISNIEYKNTIAYWYGT